MIMIMMRKMKMSKMIMIMMRKMRKMKMSAGEPAIGETNALSSTSHQKVSVHLLPLLPTLKQCN